MGLAMGPRRGQQVSLHGVMNVVSSLLLLVAVGRLLFVIRKPPLLERINDATTKTTPLSQQWLLSQQQQQQQQQQWTPQHEKQHTFTRGGKSRVSEVSSVSSEQPAVNLALGTTRTQFDISGAATSGRDYYTSQSRTEGESEEESVMLWGARLKGRVLIFTMDSLNDRVALAAHGGPAGEMKVRESLTASLLEAGVEVEVAVSDRDFERRSSTMDTYDAIVLDPWTWAGKGWRLKPQLRERREKIFILDFFGVDKIHANLGVPASRHLTAFLIGAEHPRPFLGYRVDPSEIPPDHVEKRRQGVIWGKTATSFAGGSVERLVLRLADFVELHSTVALKDATIRHSNIVYHGFMPPEKWHRLLQESKFMIGLGEPLSGPSAVDAVVAGCAYLNPVYTMPMKKLYNSQHPFLEESVGEPYVCSFGQKDIDGAMECARKALEQDLEPIIPHELTHEAHTKRVRDIFEPLMMQRYN